MDKLDFLANPHGLLLNGNKTAKTRHGGVLSIVLAAGIVAILVLEFIAYANDSTPIVIETSTRTRNYPNTTLHNTRLYPIVKLRYLSTELSADEMLQVITPALVRATSTFTFHQNGSTSVSRTGKIFPYKSCADLIKNDGNEFGDVFREQFTEAEAKFMLCPEYSFEQSYAVGNRKDSVSNTVMQFSIKPCSLDSGCIVDATELKQYEVNLMSQRLDRQFDNSTDPVRLSYEDRFVTGLESGTTNYNLQVLKTMNVWDNKGFPFSKKIRKSLPMPDETLLYNGFWRTTPVNSTCPSIYANGGLGFLQCDAFYFMELAIGDNEINATRTYTSLASALSAIGGLVTILKAALAFVYMFFHRAALNTLLVKLVFKFLPPKSPKKIMFCLKKKKSAEDKYSDDQPKIERVVKEDKIEYLHVTQEIYDQALEKIKEHADMITLIRELFNLKLLVNALMKNYQRRVAPLVILSNSLMEEKKATEKKLKDEKAKSQNRTITGGAYALNSEEPNELLTFGNNPESPNRLSQASPDLDLRTPRVLTESKIISGEANIEHISDNLLTLDQICTVLNLKSLTRERDQALAIDEAVPHYMAGSHQNYSQAIDQYCLDSLMCLKSDLGIKEIDPAILNDNPRYTTANTKINKELEVNSPVYASHTKEE